MFRLFALLRAIIPALASISREGGSIPFWLMRRNPLSFESQLKGNFEEEQINVSIHDTEIDKDREKTYILFLSSITFRTR